MFIDLIERICAIVRKDPSIKTVDFHNFSRFDGIMLVRHLSFYHKYRLKPLMRNRTLYELSVSEGNRMLFRIRDSYHLLPSSLDSLAKNLCPGLGSKGSIQHEDVTLSKLKSMKTVLLDYLRQDILLLGGVMQKAQELYWNAYKVDIVTKITISSLALSIFRMSYYDPLKFPIHIPSENEDRFIRRGDYGGHAEVYIPHGENLYYYDVNSLYPFIMKTFPMPGGHPVWHSSLQGQDLDSLYGFIEAYVVCPKTIKRPPYPDKKTNILLFPTGEFVGVYYSEEFKFARDLGYTVVPLSGYLFEKKESPFESFVSSLFESRSKAKKDGNDALSYVYKMLMNSLYGRFGINPSSTVTELCSKDRYNYLLRNTEFIYAEPFSDNNYIVCYWSGKASSMEDWKPPKISAVQLAAAITACARIYMYPFISREDCYYTDTDSVVLGHPLPEEWVSSEVLGLFKLEHRVKEGYFLVPKSYRMIDEYGHDILKHKGPAKSITTPEWFKSQYEDPSQERQVNVTANFRIDYRKMIITKKDLKVTLGIKIDLKRTPIFDKHNNWVDSLPKEITDLGGISTLGRALINNLRMQLQQLQEHQILNILAERERVLAMNDQDIYKDRSHNQDDKDNIIESKEEKIILNDESKDQEHFHHQHDHQQIVDNQDIDQPKPST